MSDRSVLDWAGASVWLATHGGRVAHSTHGECNGEGWRTECGCIIQQAERVDSLTGSFTRVREYGSMIQWRLLNHDMVRLCARCFK